MFALNIKNIESNIGRLRQLKGDGCAGVEWIWVSADGSFRKNWCISS